MSMVRCLYNAVSILSQHFICESTSTVLNNGARVHLDSVCVYYALVELGVPEVQARHCRSRTKAQDAYLHKIQISIRHFSPAALESDLVLFVNLLMCVREMNRVGPQWGVFVKGIPS